MISCPTVRKEEIRWHYDLVTVFYRLLWGRHIHHGLWNDSESANVAQQRVGVQALACPSNVSEPAHVRESANVAQQRLLETLASEAQIQNGSRILDVGCGMGGSSIHLARALGCNVTGVTLSPFQRRWAACSALWHGVRGSTRFLCADAEQVSFPAESFDVVWSIECTEHLFDKPKFFQSAGTWLKPGGRLAICAWLAGSTSGNQALDKQVYDVCDGFLCPSLGTKEDYQGWIEAAGMKMLQYHDWTSRVDRTWEICLERARRTGMPYLARMIDKSASLFVDRFETILKAYRSGAMAYGCFIATR